ncbi:arylsulfatase [Saccharicrinis aurantiacus]|uniref:arylsulfatase n=1 Tax=Saccharicrinis aurantiacus TaxID=1849719 RepID=UPI00248F4D15|nr:arylsulfatase [Saccharicrinis aurantiacus]
MKTKPSLLTILILSFMGVINVVAQEVLPFAPVPSASVPGRTLGESSHQKRSVPKHLPDDAPNIIIVLLDDVGPGQAGAYGGEINTPTLEKIANEGISYNRFHSTAMCSPTRSALLTGRNHHRVGNGVISEYSNDWDGYSGVIPQSSATVAEVLKQYGYATSAFGKWHNTHPSETSEMGPYDRWPTGYGFEHFYGFLGGEASQYEPTLVENTNLVDQSKIHREGYHLSEDLADQAIDWLHKHKSHQPEKPFFLYWSSGAAHGPHHVTKEWADKYKGQFDDGWDEYRKRVYERAKKMGWIPENTQLTPRPESMPAWEDIPEDEKAFQTRLMEVYAGFMEHVDVQVGRMIDEVDELGYKDNTIVFYIWGDNGASAEGQNGTISELLAQNTIKTTTKQQIEALEKIGGLDEIGGPKVENMQHAAWAWAGSSPYKATKLVASHFGGTRQPMAVRWPKKIKADATPRPQFHHVNDIAPTIYDILDITPPRVVSGIEQDPIDGTSMTYTFDDAEVEGTKKTQYFEIMGSRGIYHDGWYACTFGPRIPWVPGLPEGFNTWTPDNDTWELYNLDEDWSQANDLAKKHPEKLQQMKDIFLMEATKNKALPIGGSFWSTAAMHPEDAPMKPTTEWNFPSPITRIPEANAPRIGNTNNSVVINAEVTEKTNGVLYALGPHAGGISMFVENGYLNYEYNLFLMERTKIRAKKRLPSGKVKIEVISRMEENKIFAPLMVTIKVNGEVYATGKVPKTAPSMFSFNDGFDIGTDLGSPVAESYYDKAPFEFDGEINNVVIKYID